MIFQTSIPYSTDPKPLPGVAPLAADGWIIHDDAFAAQMAKRDQLLTQQNMQVVAYADPNPDALAEVLTMVLAVIHNRSGYQIDQGRAQRPDGIWVDLNGPPLEIAARLIQEDLLLHEKRSGEWTLTAGVLCFPASWSLHEKIGKGLTRIHEPVPQYDRNINKRVARLFDGVQPGRPLWRRNVLTYADPDLFHPRTEAAPRAGDHAGKFLRSEHQAVVRLPQSAAVLFAIHTYVIDTTCNAASQK